MMSWFIKKASNSLKKKNLSITGKHITNYIFKNAGSCYPPSVKKHITMDAIARSRRGYGHALEDLSSLTTYSWGIITRADIRTKKTDLKTYILINRTLTSNLIKDKVLP